MCNQINKSNYFLQHNPRIYPSVVFFDVFYVKFSKNYHFFLFISNKNEGIWKKVKENERFGVDKY